MSFCFNSLKSSTLFNEIILKELHILGYTDITPALLGVFAFLAEAEPLSISTLAKSLGQTRQAAHKNVGKLESSGYLTLVNRPQNQKEKIIVLTEKGEALVRHSLRVITKTQEKMAGFIGSDAFEEYLKKQQELTAFLEKMASDDLQ